MSASSGQVQQTPTKRSKKGLWIAVAAVAVLGGVITFAVVNRQSNGEVTTVAADQPEPPPAEAATVDKAVEPATAKPRAADDDDDDDGVDVAARVEEATKNLPAGIKKQVRDALPDPKRVEKAEQTVRKAAGIATAVPDADPIAPNTTSVPPPPPRPDTWIEDRTLTFAGWNPKRVDVGAFIRFALAEAKKAMPDAQLTRIGVTGVTPDGYANLELPTLASSHGDIELRFISPSHSKPDPNTPAGLPVKLACEFRIQGDPNGVEITPMFKTNCKERGIAPPRCSAAALWKLALVNKAPSNAVANISYYQASMHDKPRFFFDVGFGHDVIYSKVFYNADCP